MVLFDYNLQEKITLRIILFVKKNQYFPEIMITFL